MIRIDAIWLATEPMDICLSRARRVRRTLQTIVLNAGVRKVRWLDAYRECADGTNAMSKPRVALKSGMTSEGL